MTAALLEQVVDLACTAGRLTMSFYGTVVAADRKADDSPITAADRAAHDCIVRGLARVSPEVPVISEEGALPAYEIRAGWRRFWLVDPLDGTKEFLSGNGEFTVNIALIEDGEPVLGVVAAPALDTVYFAARGSGAWRRAAGRGSSRLVVASPDPHVTRVVESRSHPSAELEALLSALGAIERIKLGSSLKFCRIAEGAADLYPRFGRTMEWDVAAGDCIYRSAGPGGRELRSPLKYNQRTLDTPRFVVGTSARSCALEGVGV
jgi:3'(2'), 5'-bisphosphate nucleotidase